MDRRGSRKGTHRTRRAADHCTPILDRAPRSLPAGLRVLHVDIRYRHGVITPYLPYDEQWDTGDSPQRFKRGVYAIRIRTAPVDECRPER